jgi:hypothetical protein
MLLWTVVANFNIETLRLEPALLPNFILLQAVKDKVNITSLQKIYRLKKT